MALSKKIKDNITGMLTHYHRVHLVVKDGEKIILVIRSYAGKEYRDAEKDYIDRQKVIDVKQSELSALMESNVNQENDDQIAALTDEINALYQGQTTAGQSETFLKETEIVINSSEDFTFSTLYELLGETKEFEGATNV